jgi:hypothetical protein
MQFDLAPETEVTNYGGLLFISAMAILLTCYLQGTADFYTIWKLKILHSTIIQPSTQQIRNKQVI